MGIASRINSRFKEAVEYLRKAVALKPDSVQVQFYLGLSLIDAELYDDAGSAFREVVRIKPDFADGHMMLGNLYRENIPEPDKAAVSFKKSREIVHETGRFSTSGLHPPTFSSISLILNCFRFFEFQRNGIDAIAKASGFWPIFKYMTEVRLAFAT